MDLQICALLSALETVGLTGSLQASPSPSLAFESSRNELLKTFAALFLAQYTLLKIFRIFVQPIFFSPLRHLPTPKVRTILPPSHLPLLLRMRGTYR